MKLLNKVFRKLFYFAFVFVFCAGVITVHYKFISLSTAAYITDDVRNVPDYATVLVLGSGTTTDPQSRNYSFSSRMDKTAELYRNGKIRKIIVSGLSNKMYYNEPNDMKNLLIQYNIPSRVIYPDHGGLRTFLSVKRLNEIASQQPVIIISQRLQLERALYIARLLHIRSFGLEAAAVPQLNNFTYELHEMLARVKSFYECLVN